MLPPHRLYFKIFFIFSKKVLVRSIGGGDKKQKPGAQASFYGFLFPICGGIPIFFFSRRLKNNQKTHPRLASIIWQEKKTMDVNKVFFVGGNFLCLLSSLSVLSTFYFMILNLKQPGKNYNGKGGGYKFWSTKICATTKINIRAEH